MRTQVQSQLARLLAKENIEIRHGNYKTAFFDVENRVLGLPMWKDKGKDVYDLLVGHEVGHALFTPADGWHDSTQKLEVPRAYVNIVEDIRIEKKIQRQYPGLVASFLRGYSTLIADDFFGTEGTDINDYKFIDRLNLKAKGGRLIDVEFSDVEKPIVKKAMAVETWEDVLEVCKMLMDYHDQHEQEEEMNDIEGLDMESPADEGNMSEPSDPTDQPSTQQSSAQQQTEEEGDNSAESDASDSSKNMDDYTSETDSKFRENEKSLVDDDRHAPRIIPSLTHDQIKGSTINVADVMDQRNTEDAEQVASWKHPGWEGDYDAFMKETKGIVAVMAKEFEMRKAAYQYSRAQEAKTGAINPLKLHTYKYNEDIFNRVMNLADAKSHGLVMYIDYSGSMYKTIFEVIQQTICLTQFCKKVNIPFEVYGFTSQSHINDDFGDIGPAAFTADTLRITQLLTNKMRKSEYNKAMKDIYLQGRSEIFEGIDRLGATPLNETIMAAHEMVPRFQRANNLQKVTTVFLTDGEASNMYTGMKTTDTERKHLADNQFTRRFNIQMPKRLIKPKTRVSLTTELFESLKECTGTTLIGFFVSAHNSEFRDFLLRREMPYDEMNTLRRKFNKEKSIKLEDIGGYDELYMLKSGTDLAATTDEFEVKDHAKKGEIMKAFKKFANSRKSNRIIMTAFAKKVA